MPSKPRLKEVLFYAAVMAAGTFLLIQFDAFDRVYEFSRAHEEWELDEYLLAIPVAVICLALYAFSRARQLEAARRELAETHDKLLTLNRNREQFIAVSCHELRSPLNGIVHALSLMEMAENPEECHESVDFAQAAAGELSSLIDGVLEFARLSHDGKGRVKVFSPGRLLESVYITARLQAESKGLELNTSLEENVPESVEGNEAALRLAVLNLVGNAVKYTETGRVDVNMAWAGKQLVISINDTGVGIPREKLEAVFTPYGKGDDTGSTPGVGLGLDIVNRLVNGMGGTIFFASDPGKGTHFSLKIPVDVV